MIEQQGRPGILETYTRVIAERGDATEKMHLELQIQKKAFYHEISEETRASLIAMLHGGIACKDCGS